MVVGVECYAGYKGGERPVRFFLGERRYEVEEILDQWYGPDHAFFRLRADDGNTYILRHSPSAAVEAWTLESFRSSQK
jgi:hypothetical protein